MMQGPSSRVVAWCTASELVAPIVAIHGIEKYSIGSIGSTTAVYTPTEQHVDLVLRVAEWLVEE